jgi:hypothetical protein
MTAKPGLSHLGKKLVEGVREQGTRRISGSKRDDMIGDWI